MKNKPYNVGLSNANLSKIELCKEIIKIIPDFVYFESEIGEDPDKRNYIVSNEKIVNDMFYDLSKNPNERFLQIFRKYL